MAGHPIPMLAADSAEAKKCWTVEEASRWLTCAQPLPNLLLGQLGKDCSMVARIRNTPCTQKPVYGRPWPTERAYPVEIIREVFSLNPLTSPHLPKA